MSCLSKGELFILAFIGGCGLVAFCALLFCAWIAAWGLYDRLLEKRARLNAPHPSVGRDCFSYFKGARK